MKAIPTTIFRLFGSIIDARTKTHNFYLQSTASNSDPEVQKSNKSHRIWIHGLTEGFHILGGESWKKEKGHASDAPDQDEEGVIFANVFSVLSLDNKMETGEGEGEEIEDGDEEGAEEPPNPVHKATQRERKTSKKEKKGKQGKKTKTKGAKMEFTSDWEIRIVPLESYGIIQDESGKTVIYYRAIYSIIHQWMILRHHLHLCNVAIEMIKDSQSMIFVDFQGYEPFHSIIETITSGDPEQARTFFDISISRLGADGVIETFPDSNLDMKEELLVHTFPHPCDFVIDYRKNGSGKPTKAMLKSIKNWDPHCDFSSMSKEGRLQWRRSFTIKWLYDLVNQFVWYVITSLTMEEQDFQPKTVEWSKADHRMTIGVYSACMISLAISHCSLYRNLELR
ncbi:hypothetical protein N7488_005135 [Penicillium malachiteum]|nr:hypothetical protein N7488_005135 [Penicillium malachiteum]